VHAPPHELFIVLDQFQPRYRELSVALAPLADAADEGPLVIGSHAYYRADTDVALLAVRFDRRSFNPHKLAWVLAVLERSQLLVLNPEKLREDDRKNFYGSYLPLYRVRVEAADGPRAALDELARLLSVPSAPPRPAPTPPGIDLDLSPDRRYAVPRSALASRVVAVPLPGAPPPDAPPARRAEATPSRLAALDYDAERDAVPASGEDSATTRLSGEAPSARRPHDDTAGRYQLVRSGARERLPMAASGVRHPSAARRHLTPTPSLPREARGKPRRSERRTTLPSTPLAMTPRRPPRASMPPPDIGQVEGGYAPAIGVRFLRGDEWVQARLRSINLRGARLAAGAPPRLGDLVQLVVGLRGQGTVVAGEVTQVIGARDAEDGSTGFAVSFSELSGAAREQLVALLTRAREAGVALRPPPPRAAARFPVRWPTHVLTARGEIDGAALDVSAGGLFLATDAPISSSEVGFRMSLDLGEGEVEGRAHVAREVNDEMASARGLPRGYGVRILGLEGAAAARWGEFLERVQARSERRLLVAARPQRAEALLRSLAGAGYVVTAGSDAHSLIEQTDGDPRPPDAALIDVGLAELDPASQRLRRMFNLRRVPCVTIGDEAPDRARMVVDHLLHIT
jgi:hypothetical protein